MKINEITRTGNLATVKGQKKPDNSDLYDTIDFEKIYKLETALINVYFTIDDNEYITAIVSTTKNNELIQMENISGKKGLITIIFFSILSRERQLKIKPTEEMTYEGLRWLLGANRFQKYFSITDYDNNPVSCNELENDWMDESKRIGIILTTKKSLNEDIYKYQHQENYGCSLIMPYLKWVGDKDLL